ncbi:MAG: ABC transporter permease [candidate division KSB1 bacterium]|nr:ABC transporter permease [candidate division KSB1 bacterium]
MRGLWKMTWTECKLLMREPVVVFFTLIFPLMMLFLFGTIYGNKPNPMFGGYGSVDVSVPAYAAMIIATSSLLSLTIQIAAYREHGILRRFRATPLHPGTILAAQVIVIFVITTAGMVLLVVAGKLVYHMRFAGNWLLVLIAFVLSSTSFFGLGFVLASVLPTTRASQIVAMVLFYPMLFLSGATIPRELLPENLRRLAEALPLTHVVTLLRGLWVGDPLGRHVKEIAILVALLGAGAAVSSKTFRWE